SEGVVVQHLDSDEASFSLADHPIEVGGPGYIDHQRQCLAARTRHLASDCSGFLLVDVCDDDRSASRGKTKSSRAANPRSAAGYNSNFSIKTHRAPRRNNMPKGRVSEDDAICKSD